jgi:hypothetical protein
MSVVLEPLRILCLGGWGHFAVPFIYCYVSGTRFLSVLGVGPFCCSPPR